MKGVQCKNHTMKSMKSKKYSMSCFDDKLYIQNNWFDGLALGYQS